MLRELFRFSTMLYLPIVIALGCHFHAGGEQVAMTITRRSVIAGTATAGVALTLSEVITAPAATPPARTRYNATTPQGNARQICPSRRENEGASKNRSAELGFPM